STAVSLNGCSSISGVATNAYGDPLANVTVTEPNSSTCPAPTSAVSDAAAKWTVMVRDHGAPIALLATATGYLDGHPMFPKEATFAMYLKANTWTDPGCAEDGNPQLSQPVCIPPGPQPQPAPSPLSCLGA